MVLSYLFCNLKGQIVIYMCTFYIYKTETLSKRYCLSFKRTFVCTSSVYFTRLKNEKRIYNVY